jgi:putative membrane protein
LEEPKSRIILFTAASVAALSLAACGDNMNSDSALMTPATETALADPASADNVAREAQDFVNAAGQASLVEIRTSEMALEKSTSADVKAFAQMMIDNHKAAIDRLKAAASSASLRPPLDVLDDFHMRRINDLVETDGDADFDADYSALQIDAHNDAIKLFEDYAKDTDATAQLKMFADETLPTLQAHKAEAEKIREIATKADKSPNPS